MFNLININPDVLHVFFQEKGSDYFNEKYNIGVWYWELSEFPDEWLQYFDYIDELCVASDFIVNALSLHSTVPIVKIAPPVAAIMRDSMRD